MSVLSESALAMASGDDLSVIFTNERVERLKRKVKRTYSDLPALLMASDRLGS